MNAWSVGWLGDWGGGGCRAEMYLQEESTRVHSVSSPFLLLLLPVCLPLSQEQTKVGRTYSYNLKFVSVKIFPSHEIGVFAAVINHFFQFLLPLLVLVVVYSHIAVILWSKSCKNALTEVSATYYHLP